MKTSVRGISQKVSNLFSEINAILSSNGSAKVRYRRTVPFRTILISWVPEKIFDNHVYSYKFEGQIYEMSSLE